MKSVKTWACGLGVSTYRLTVNWFALKAEPVNRFNEEIKQVVLKVSSLIELS